MKKSKIVKIPAKKAVAAKPATTKRVEIILCDFCGATTSGMQYEKCDLCNRDCCRKHLIPHWPDGGDYTEYYCSICMNLKFNKYSSTFYEIEQNYEDELERLNDQIREESLESPIS